MNLGKTTSRCTSSLNVFENSNSRGSILMAKHMSRKFGCRGSVYGAFVSTSFFPVHYETRWPLHGKVPWPHYLGCCVPQRVLERDFSEVEPNTLSSWGRVSERWGFLYEDPIPAREHALRDTRTLVLFLFSSLRVAFWMPQSVDLMTLRKSSSKRERDWISVYTAPWSQQENVPFRTEGRALLVAIRHKFRSASNFEQCNVFLVDNLLLALACCKMRAKSEHLKPILRTAAAHALCTGCRLCVRRPPSEFNPSDRGSR